MSELNIKKQRKIIELWSGYTATGTLILPKSFNEFKEIAFEFASTNGEKVERMVSAEFLLNLANGERLFAGGFSDKFILLKKESNNSISLPYATHLAITKVKGIKEV